MEHAELAVLDEPDTFRCIRQEMPVMRDDDADTVEGLEHMLYRRLGMQIEVIRRFIHDDDMRFREEHFGESHFRTFSARERLDGLMPFLVLYEEPSEHAAYLLAFVVVFAELVHDRGFRVQIS